jgi:hypothetical protein
MPDSHITDEMRGAIGRRFGRTVSYPVDRSDIRKWAIAVYYPELPPAHYIEDAAAEALYGEGGLVAPEDFNPFAWLTAEPGLAARRAEIDLNFYETALGIPGPGLAVNLNSGITVEYGVRIRPGDVITRESWVDEYTEKIGRMGLMLFTYLVAEMTNQRGELVRRTRQLGIRY